MALFILAGLPVAPFDRAGAGDVAGTGPLIGRSALQRHPLRIFELTNKSLVSIGEISSGSGLHYTQSADLGKTWTTPVAVPGGATGGQFDAQQSGNYVFVAAFEAASGASDLEVTRLDFSGSTVVWQREQAAPLATHYGPPSLALRHQATPVAMAVGYARPKLTGGYEYATQIRNVQALPLWSVSPLCSSSAASGMVVSQSDLLLHCITEEGGQPVDHIFGVSVWGSGTAMPGELGQAGDGERHYDFVADPRPYPLGGLIGVVSSPGGAPFGGAKFMDFDRSSSQWQIRATITTRPVKWPRLGVAKDSGTNYPTFTIVGENGTDRLHSYSSAGGTTWKRNPTLGIEPLAVVDVEPTSWGEDYLSTNAGKSPLFEFRAGTNRLGNTVGSGWGSHPMTTATSRTAAIFTAGSTRTVDHLDLRLDVTYPTPTYRVGLQSTTNGVPSGTWLVENRSLTGQLLSGSYQDVTPLGGGATTAWFMSNPASLTQGTAYAIVAEPAPVAPGGTAPSATTYAALATSKARAGTPLAYGVKTSSGTGWSSVADEVPLFYVAAGAATADRSDTEPFLDFKVNDYLSVAAEFTTAAALDPEALSIYVSQKPTTSSTLTLLVQTAVDNATVWSINTPELTVGWNDLAIEGLSLAASTAYRLRFTSPDPGVFYDYTNTWKIGTSSGSSLNLVESDAKPGVNHRAQEAMDGLNVNGSVDFAPMKYFAGTGSTVLIGDDAPFEHLRLAGAVGSVSVSVEYSTASGWAPHPGFAGSGTTLGAGSVALDFTAPVDWVPTQIDGASVYGMRLMALNANHYRIDTLTKYWDSDGVALAPQTSHYAHVVWASRNYGATSLTMRHQPLAAVLATTASDPVSRQVFSPMSARAKTPREAALRPAVSATAAGYAVTGSDAALSLTRNPNDGFTLGFPDVSINVKPSVAVAANANGLLSDYAVFYPDVLPTTDLIVKPMRDGLQTFNILRSPESPASYTWQVTSPAGAVLLDETDNRLLVTLAGQAVAEVLAPWAVDSRGNAIPVTVSTSGNTITVSVNLAGIPGGAYPVILDPGFARQSRNYEEDEIFGPTHKFRVRGYNMAECIEFGKPCRSRNNNYRPEATAQAHAIRRLAKKLAPGRHVTERLDWEVAPYGDPYPDGGDDDDYEPSCYTTNSFRIDISLDMRGYLDAGGHYRLIEVKHASGWVEAVNQLNCYVSRMRANFDLNTDKLNELNSEAWAVYWWWQGQKWYAWAPETGIVLFANGATEPERIPAWVTDKAHETGNEQIYGSMEGSIGGCGECKSVITVIESTVKAV